MLIRDAEKTIRSLSKGYPVIAITGPRQSGKTTAGIKIYFFAHFSGYGVGLNL